MASLFDTLQLPDEPYGDAPWFMEGYDDDPRSEFERQRAFVTYMRRNAPRCLVFAVPNGHRASDWQKVRKWNEGAVAGMTDLVILWAGGQFFAEFKDADGRPSPRQVDVLNWLHRMGYRCGVYRRRETLVAHLKEMGAPFL